MSKALVMQVYSPLLLVVLILLSPLNIPPPLILHKIHVLSSPDLTTPLSTRKHIQHQRLYTVIDNHGKDFDLLHALSFKFTF
jgi:hypothetical protein